MNQSPQDVQSMEVLHQLETLLADDFPSAKSQLQRHISNSNSIQRRRASRISKTSSAGTSPQHYQRRRHTTSQTIPRQRRAVYQQCLQTPTSEIMSHVRPVSWQPSSMTYSQPQQHLIPNYATQFTYGIPTPMAYSNSSMINKGWYNPEDPSGFYQQSSDYSIGMDTSMQGSYFKNDYPEPSAVFSPVICPNSAIPGHLSTYSTYTAPATPDFLAAPEVDTTPQRPTLPRTNSKELVGMGLYDGPDRYSWTLDNYMDTESTTRPLSLGKGLKLEETWEPPEEEDKTDDEEEDEAEEEEEAETIQQQLEQVAKEVPQLPPMSITNQSFFPNTQDVLSAQTGFAQYNMMPSYGMVL